MNKERLNNKLTCLGEFFFSNKAKNADIAGLRRVFSTRLERKRSNQEWEFIIESFLRLWNRPNFIHKSY